MSGPWPRRFIRYSRLASFPRSANHAIISRFVAPLKCEDARIWPQAVRQHAVPRAHGAPRDIAGSLAHPRPTRYWAGRAAQPATASEGVSRSERAARADRARFADETPLAAGPYSLGPEKIE